jgi:hypothetical protein
MPTIQFPRKGTGKLAAAPIAAARVIDVTVDMANDVTVGTTDDLVVADLPGGTVVVAAGIEQIVAGTAGNTLAARVGTQAVGATLASDAAVGTVTAPTAAQLPRVVPAAGETLNVLSADGSRVTGKIRVWAVVLEGTKIPATATAVVRDTSTL